MSGKLLGLLILRRVVLQIVAGLLADAMFLPLIPATVLNRLSWALFHPLSFYACHWLLGVVVLALTSTIVLQMRESLRYPLVAHWTRQHSGTVTQMLREAIDRPLLQHLWSTCVMLGLSSVFVLGLVLAPASLAALAGSRMQLMPARVFEPVLERAMAARPWVLENSSTWSMNASYPVRFPDDASPSAMHVHASYDASPGTDSDLHTVDASSAFYGLLSAIRSGDVTRGTITVLSVQCLPSGEISRPMPDVLHDDSGGLHSLPPACPNGRLLALRLSVRYRRSSRRGVFMSDLSAEPLDDGIPAFSVGGLVGSAAAVASSTPTVSGNSSSEGEQSADGADPESASKVVLHGFNVITHQLFKQYLVMHELVSGVLQFFGKHVAGAIETMYLGLRSSRDGLDGNSTADPRTAMLNASDTTDGTFIYEDAPDAVFQSPEGGEPTSNITVLEGSHEFALLAPSVWRALALVALEESIGHDRPDDELFGGISGTEWLDASKAAARERLALAMLPLGMMGRSYVAVIRGRPNETNVSVASESGSVSGRGLSESPAVPAAENEAATQQKSETENVDDDNEQSVEILLRRMPVLRFYSLARPSISIDQLYLNATDDGGSPATISAMNRAALLASPAFAHIWRLRFVGFVEVETKPLRNFQTGENLMSPFSNSTRVSISGSRFFEFNPLHLTYLLPPSVVPVVDDVTFWWASPSEMIDALLVSVAVAWHRIS